MTDNFTENFAKMVADTTAEYKAEEERYKALKARRKLVNDGRAALMKRLETVRRITDENKLKVNQLETAVELGEQELGRGKEVLSELEDSITRPTEFNTFLEEGTLALEEDTELAEAERNLLVLEEEIQTQEEVQPREETQPEEPESTSTERTVIEPASNVEEAETATPDLWTATGFDDAEAEMLPAGSPLVPFKQTEEHEIMPQVELVTPETLAGGQATPVSTEGANLLTEDKSESLPHSTETDSGTKFPFWAKLLTFGVVAYATALLGTWATCNELFRTSYGCKARNVLEFNLEEKGDQEAPKTRENNDSSNTSLEPRATL